MRQLHDRAVTPGDVIAARRYRREMKASALSEFTPAAIERRVTERHRRLRREWQRAGHGRYRDRPEAE